MTVRMNEFPQAIIDTPAGPPLSFQQPLSTEALDCMPSEHWLSKHAHTGFYPPVTYLLIDDLFIARKQHVQRVVIQAEKVAQPVIRADQPCEGRYIWMHNGFLYDPDEKVFKLWYHTDDPSFREDYPDLTWEYRRAYAVSKDCLTWEKPKIGVVEWHGSYDNNLISIAPHGGDGATCNVFKDPREPDPNRRYKAIGVEYGYPGQRVPSDPITCRQRHHGLFIYDSPDGFVWTRRSVNLMSTSIVLDGLYVLGFDEDYQAWIFWIRPRANPKRRTIGVSFARDLDKIPFPQSVFFPDYHDPADAHFDRFGTIKVPGGYVGLVAVMVESEGYKRQPQLAFSRDARVWGRPAGREPVIPCGDPGAWDDMGVVPTNPILVGDEIYIMYIGVVAGNSQFYMAEENGRKVAKKLPPPYWSVKLPDGRTNLPGLGLAKMKRDRWAAIEPLSRHGVLETRHIAFANRFLQINADGRHGSIRAELLDCWGKPVPGFTIAESDPFTGDSLDHTMTWRGKSTFPRDMIGDANQQGDPCRLMAIRFYLDSARLFSFIG